jgi:hypothetical protein
MQIHLTDGIIFSDIQVIIRYMRLSYDEGTEDHYDLLYYKDTSGN